MAVTGLVEYAGTASVIGWAYDPESPTGRLEITVRIRDEFLASGFADIDRKDLLLAGMGDGKHGFNIDISESGISADDAGELIIHGISGADIEELARAQVTPERIIDLTSAPDEPTSDPKQRPVFILGPARSGTSAMTLALLDSGAYLGTGEGHLLPLAHALVGTIDQYYQKRAEDPHTLLGKLPIAAFQKLIRRSFVRLAADLFPTRRWLDKTPTVEMVRASVLMKELWPNARFIFMKRRVVENVLSRQRKFPQDDTERHYSDWLAVMSAWLAVRDQLGTSAIEIEHRHLVLEPDATVTTIAKFLQLPQDAAARFRSYLTERRPEQTDTEFGAVYSLERLGLNDADAARLRAACDPVMAALGYSYGEEYFSADDPAASARPPRPQAMA
jgi:sulfotransferase family protein